MNEKRRYIIEKFEATSLESNPLGDSTQKEFYIYLPPGYHETSSQDVRFPVIYMLHGYSGGIEDLLVIEEKEIKTHFELLFRVLLCRFFKKFLTFEKLDSLILQKEIPPFILVQPDASIPRFNIHGTKGFNGQPNKKGSLYVNSPHTGKYGDYIFEDLIAYVDANYKTLAHRDHRAVMGGSMGGFGSLIGGLLYNHQFSAVSALSPAISWLELLDHPMVVPIYKLLYGRRKAKRLGAEDIEDILDTCDLIFANDTPLIPTLKRDESSNEIIAMDENAKNKWISFDLKEMLKSAPSPFHNIKLQILCEESDEYGFGPQIAQFVTELDKLGIEHSTEIYKDSFAARISPHMLGIERNILKGIKFCLKSFD
ncbi:MAG: alpha/beta hydrolase [Promethearchaeota archaeon]